MLKLSGIIQDSIVDGPGIRTVIFTQGCPHHCPGCQNPDTWDFEGGTEMSVERVYEIIRSNPLGRSVTFSGGEPFSQPEELTRLAKMLKKDGYEIASYTGYTVEQLLRGTEAQKELLANIDVLVDGPFLLSERSLDVIFRGSRNQRILNAKESLKKGMAVEETSPRWHGDY